MLLLFSCDGEIGEIGGEVVFGCIGHGLNIVYKFGVVDSEDINAAWFNI